MKRAASLVMTEVEPTTMVVQGLIDGVGVQELMLQPEAKRMKVQREVVYGEGIPSVGQQTAPHYQDLTAEKDIKEPFSIMKQMVEGDLQSSLADHQSCFQDCSLFDVDKSLVEQCVKGEDILKIKSDFRLLLGTQPKVNTTNIWKTEDLVHQAVLQEQDQLQLHYVDGTADGDNDSKVLPVETADIESESPVAVVEEHVPMMQASIPTTNQDTVAADENKNVVSWVVHENFRREQEQLNIPFDPLQWTPAHVQHWIQWAVKEFGLLGVNENNFQLDGQQLCNLTYPEFVSFIPSDPGDVFWTHLEMLRNFKYVAVRQESLSQPTTSITVVTDCDAVRQKPLSENTSSITVETNGDAVDNHVPMTQASIPTTNKEIVAPDETQNVEKTENIPRWYIHENFCREQERLKIPSDPLQWTKAHVQHWIQWAVKEFGLLGVDENNFQLDGQQLCNLTYTEFVTFIPSDPDDVFWTHLELLKKCKVIAVNRDPRPQPTTFGNGKNSKIQLWQFLLELLEDKEKVNIISWVGDDGEFKLNDTNEVSRLWGQRKNKPNMNYDKLSRALRFYYDDGIIEKVRSKPFVYKFVRDPKAFVGSVAERIEQAGVQGGFKHHNVQQENVHVEGILPMNRIQQEIQTCQTMD